VTGAAFLGAQAGVAQQIVSALKEYDRRLPVRLTDIQQRLA
jgi:hypothetical protein